MRRGLENTWLDTMPLCALAAGFTEKSEELHHVVVNPGYQLVIDMNHVSQVSPFELFIHYAIVVRKGD